jgi:hypothetical protein
MKIYRKGFICPAAAGQNAKPGEALRQAQCDRAALALWRT